MPRVERHTLSSLLLLVMLIFTGAFIFALLGYIFIGFIYGFDALFLHIRLPDNQRNIDLSRILDTFYAIGTVIAPAWLFAKMERTDRIHHLKLNRASPLFVILTITLMPVVSPILDWTVLFNEQIKLPDALSDLEGWLRHLSDYMFRITERLLIMERPANLFVNLLTMAIIPAILEELIFRVYTQDILSRWTGNPHISIFLTALIFSAIHMQFFAVIPRMLLGVFFGYLLLWSNSIYLPVLAHFMNNAAFLISYYHQHSKLTLAIVDEAVPRRWFVYVFSVLLTTLLLYIFYRHRKKLIAPYPTCF